MREPLGGMVADRRSDGSIGDALEGVRWDIRKPRQKTSLLEPMNRYFSNFPWDGSEEAEEQETAEQETEEQPEP